MASVWLGTYETAVFDTPDGRLSDEQYAVDGKVTKEGMPLYIVRIDDATQRERRSMWEVKYTDDPTIPMARTKVKIVGTVCRTAFRDESTGAISRRDESSATLARLRTQPGAAKPVDDGGRA